MTVVTTSWSEGDWQSGRQRPTMGMGQTTSCRGPGSRQRLSLAVQVPLSNTVQATSIHRFLDSPVERQAY